MTTKRGRRNSSPLRASLHHDSWFLTLPVEWAERMLDRCPSRAARVGLALWHLAGRRRTRQALSVSARDVTFYMGGSEVAARRGLADLARAKLITLTRRPRHRYLVTLPDEQTLQAWLEEQARQGPREEDVDVVRGGGSARGGRLRGGRVSGRL
jgi:hypothetical protein